MDVPKLALDEPLSPELVLVLPAELRARVIADLGDPVRPTPRPRPAEVPAPLRLRQAPVPAPLARTRVRQPPVAEPSAFAMAPFARSVGTLVGTRLLQLGLIFVAVTIVTLAMTLVAQAVR